MNERRMPEADMGRPAKPEHGGASPPPTSTVLKQLEGKIKAQRKHIAELQQCLKDRNRSLDALHYVWCTGGCSSGQHRWCKGEVTEEMMREAALQMKRLQSRYGNVEFRKLPREVQAAWFESDHFKRFMTERKQQFPTGDP